MSKFLACLSAGLLISTVAMGQSKLAEEADAAFSKGYYFNAIELYKKAYTVEKKASDKAALIFKVGECYRTLGDAQQAEVWYEKANKAQYNDPITYFYLGEALKEQGKYAEAIAAYNKYKDKNPGDARAAAGIAASQVAQQWKDNPSRYSVDPEVLLNSQQYDFTPGFADKKNDDVVFTSTRSASTGTNTDQIIGESFSDLFSSSRDKLGKWSEPVKLPPSIDTEGNEGAPTFNAKRTIMYFTRCPFEKNKVHGCDIWISKKVGSNYSEPEMLALRPAKSGTSKLDTPVVTIGHPALSPDDQTLFFSSNMKGGRGGKDIWMVKLDKDGKPVGSPSNLGAEINTPKEEMFPFNRHDGSFYFSSDGHPGMGGMDIFRAEKTGDASWGQVENVKFPSNSSMDDFGIIFDGTEERGYFTSNRPGGKGQDDIWRFYMPDLVFALQGTVYDKVTSQPLPGAKIEVVGTDGSSFSALSDDNGGFNFAENGKDRFVKENTTYTIRASKDEYLVVNDQVTTVGIDESTTFVKEYFLQPARKDVVIAMPEVQYELGSFALTQAGRDSLEFLYGTLTENPTIVIELAAHTDSRDTDKRNQVLSENRAKSCVNYLVSKGIDPARLQAVGYGESKLRITDAEIKAMKTKEEQEAAHQMNRRTEFRVLSFDHVPKDPGTTPPAPAPNN
ncbi:MAG: OmpA family protein [Flavobacteriales bacterium]|nr:OmpA family protein [Flavobacteriales bacterium]